MAEKEVKRNYPEGRVGEAYECAICHRVFSRTVSNEKCIAEAEKNIATGKMPEDPDGNYGIVCDDCYKALGLS